jgi:hypothetical protein
MRRLIPAKTPDQLFQRELRPTVQACLHACFHRLDCTANVAMHYNSRMCPKSLISPWPPTPGARPDGAALPLNFLKYHRSCNSIRSTGTKPN